MLITPTQRALLALVRASSATQEACDALKAMGLDEAAILLRNNGEAIAMATGKLIVHTSSGKAVGQ